MPADTPQGRTSARLAAAGNLKNGPHGPHGQSSAPTVVGTTKPPSSSKDPSFAMVSVGIDKSLKECNTHVHKSGRSEPEAADNNITAASSGRESNPVTAAPSPSRPLLDHKFYPHIIDAILEHPVAWIPFGATCKEYQRRVRRLMFRHVVVSAVRRSYDSDESGYESPECHCSACAEFPLLFVELKLSSSRLNDRLTSPFPLRRYDNLTGNDRRNVKRLLNAYLQHTETMDVPIGLENQDFDWCESHLQSLKTVRYYNDPDIEPVDEEYVEGEYTLPLTANTLVIMHRGILDFNQWHYVPPIRSSVVQKVVINVPYTVPTGPIGHYMLHATSDFDCPQVVHIFHHYAKNDALPEPPGLMQETPGWQRYIEWLVELVLVWTNESMVFVDFPVSALGSPSQSQSPQAQFVADLRAALDGYPGPCFVTLEEYASRLTPQEFELEYVL
ncbi:uncharacterized protein EHS24_005104 [Apiotrichum porosum]|uniref:Uncharacterized protein n=1 Tax=Apiotrichum porosum TaxID=105984 RepID=A0A427Y6W1_9TREE|nr:uncharacterized protein EHS24_005104 [Apiotrichum porosum]RSH86829.1 hypothetical protein EHS24_005104 [Apiotrichum porosum]